MYVIGSSKRNQYPIKIWMQAEDQLEEPCLLQAINLANLPFVHQWIALMPDAHVGKGMPIGGVLAAKNVLVPNAVGVDIGCGMSWRETQLDSMVLKNTFTNNGTLVQSLIGDIMRDIPLGKKHHNKRQLSIVLDEAMANKELYGNETELLTEIEAAYCQIGTLGGGNHFIELQEDEAGKVSIMLHSGSRNLGYKICNYFKDLAISKRAEWGSTVPLDYYLDYLPADSKEGQAYVNWMNLGLAFARENRERMMQVVCDRLERLLKRVGLSSPIYGKQVDCHHNYASFEHHFGQDVWVHRKGAIRAGEGEWGIIPGAMGMPSYLVIGRGNCESFLSCSHGAGRIMSRTKAKAQFNMESVITDLKNIGVVLGKNKRSDVAEETRHAYKDIEHVIENELDLIMPVKKLTTIGVVKG